MVQKIEIEKIINLAKNFHKKNNLPEAKKLYKKILEIDSNHLESIFGLGSLYAQINEFDNAKYFLNQTIKIDPNHSKAYNNLGIVFNTIKEYKNAKDCYEKSIKINSNNEEAYNNLGLVLFELGELTESMQCYQKAIAINSNHKNAIKNISILFKKVSFDFSNIAEIKKLKNLFIFLYERNDIEHKDLFSNAIKILLTDASYLKLPQIIYRDKLLEIDIIKNLLNEKLFHLILQKSLISDLFLENLLNKIRFEILSSFVKKNNENLKENLDFITSLAQQCFLNEYCFFASNEEITWINKLLISLENKKEINELEITILGCYMPLINSKLIVNKILKHKTINTIFNDLVNMHIKEPLKEESLFSEIKSFETISNNISNKVREQYEENPFPRWRYTYSKTQYNSLVIINNQISPNTVKMNDKFNNPDILIAGCGTGKQIFIAQNYLNAKILAVDLSKKSLAYAKRKTQEAGINNVEFLHSDILNLNNLNTKFDIIECIGVLHHMEDPVEGLKILLNILKPHGFIKLGLYSDIARKDVEEIRQFIIKNNYKNTFKDIVNFRKRILEEKENKSIKKISNKLDFFSTSGIRDLLFHVQEHRFTLPQISKIIYDFDLEFLGFSDYDIKKKYSNLFLDDKKNIFLNNWHKFELENNDTFIRMYNFWIKKKS